MPIYGNFRSNKGGTDLFFSEEDIYHEPRKHTGMISQYAINVQKPYYPKNDDITISYIMYEIWQRKKY